MQPHGDYSSRKFLLASVLLAVGALGWLTGHASATEFFSFAGGVFTVFSGGDVALNAVYARQAPTIVNNGVPQ